MSFLIYNEVVSIYAPRPITIAEKKYPSLVNFIYSNVVRDASLNALLSSAPPTGIFDMFERGFWGKVREIILRALETAIVEKARQFPYVMSELMTLDATNIEFADDFDTLLGTRSQSNEVKRKSKRFFAPLDVGENLMGKALHNVFLAMKDSVDFQKRYSAFVAYEILRRLSSNRAAFDSYYGLSPNDIIGRFVYENAPEDDKRNFNQTEVINRNFQKVLSFVPRQEAVADTLNLNAELNRLIRASLVNPELLFGDVARKLSIGAGDVRRLQDYAFELYKQDEAARTGMSLAQINEIFSKDFIAPRPENFERATAIVAEMKQMESDRYKLKDAAEKEAFERRMAELEKRFNDIATYTYVIVDRQKREYLELYRRGMLPSDRQRELEAFAAQNNINIMSTIAETATGNIEALIEEALVQSAAQDQKTMVVYTNSGLSPYFRESIVIESKPFARILDYVYFKIAELFVDLSGVFNALVSNSVSMPIQSNVEFFKNSILIPQIRGNAKLAIDARYCMSRPCSNFDLSNNRALSLMLESELVEYADPNDYILGVGEIGGENFAGKYEGEIRRSYPAPDFAIDVMDEVAVANLADQDLFVREWMLSRARDMSGMLVMLCEYLRGLQQGVVESGNVYGEPSQLLQYALSSDVASLFLTTLFGSDVAMNAKNLPYGMEFLTGRLQRYVALASDVSLMIWQFIYGAIAKTQSAQFVVSSIKELVFLLFKSKFYSENAPITSSTEFGISEQLAFDALVFALQAIVGARKEALGDRNVRVGAIEINLASRLLCGKFSAKSSYEIETKMEASVSSDEESDYEPEEESTLDESDGFIQDEAADGAIENATARVRRAGLSITDIDARLLREEAATLARLAVRMPKVRRRINFFSVRYTTK